ncbi:MAG: MjaI family restriction endonuclease [Candidatus Zixiibacteriota bacterium]
MSKEWILNSATNRFQLNFKRNVGPTSLSIRACQPRSLKEWEEYYYKNVYGREHLVELGKKLHVKITEVLAAEITEVTEQDCIDYIINLVINRTYDGYVTEIKTVYGQLQEILRVEIKPASDEWDRLYNVDFFIPVKDRFIGLQIKPAGDTAHIPQIFKEHQIQQRTHEEFTAKFGSRVFYVVSITEGKGKKICNPEVVAEIQAEIARLEAR